MKKLRFLFYTVMSAYLLLGTLLFVYQRDFLYFPAPKVAHSFQTEMMPSSGQSVEVITLNPGLEDAIVYFGGNAEAIVGRAADHIGRYPEQTIYLMTYRGYSGSGGEPEEQAIYADALVVIDEVAPRHNRISIIGRSLGSGVATYVAAHRQIDRLVLVTPYDSIEALAQSSYPIFPMSIMLADKFDSFDRVGDISAPTLIVMAENDRVIPAKYSMRLASAFPSSQVNLATIDNADHNDIVRQPEYSRLMANYLR